MKGKRIVEFDYRTAAKRLAFKDLRLHHMEMPGTPPRSPRLHEEPRQSQDVDLGRNLTPAEVKPGPGEDLQD